jgi:hypothetical protein
MIKILLFGLMLTLSFVPIMEGKHVVVSARYMAYACDPACDDFKIITIVGFSPQSMVNKDVSIYFNGVPIQYINKFNIINQGQVIKFEGKTARLSLIDILRGNISYIEAIEII